MVLAAWRADVLRGARIGRSAASVDLPRRYRFNDRWVFLHLFEWISTREVQAFRREWAETPDPFDRLTRGTHDEAS